MGQRPDDHICIEHSLQTCISGAQFPKCSTVPESEHHGTACYIIQWVREKTIPGRFCNNVVKFWQVSKISGTAQLIFTTIFCRLLAKPVVYSVCDYFTLHKNIIQYCISTTTVILKTTGILSVTNCCKRWELPKCCSVTTKCRSVNSNANQQFFYRATRYWRGTIHGHASVRLSVSMLSVCQKSGVLSKRLNESSWFLAQELPSTYPTEVYIVL